MGERNPSRCHALGPAKDEAQFNSSFLIVLMIEGVDENGLQTITQIFDRMNEKFEAKLRECKIITRPRRFERVR